MTRALIARWAAVSAIVAAALLPGASAQVDMQGGSLKNVYSERVIVIYWNFQQIDLWPGQTSVPQRDNGNIDTILARIPDSAIFEELYYSNGAVTANENDECFIIDILPRFVDIVAVICYGPIPHTEPIEIDFLGLGLFCSTRYVPACQGNPNEVISRFSNYTARQLVGMQVGVPKKYAAIVLPVV